MLRALGVTVSGATHTVKNFSHRVIRSTLELLPRWRAALEHVKNLAGYVLRVIANGGWWYPPPQAMLEGAAERKSASAAARPVAVPKKTATDEPTPHRKERQAELAAREAEDMENQVRFEALWPQLTELEQARARQLVRDEMPPVVLRGTRNLESSEIFRAVLRGKVLELYGHRAAPAAPKKAAAPGGSLPLRIAGFVEGCFKPRPAAQDTLGGRSELG